MDGARRSNRTTVEDQRGSMTERFTDTQSSAVVLSLFAMQRLGCALLGTHVVLGKKHFAYAMMAATESRVIEHAWGQPNEQRFACRKGLSVTEMRDTAHVMLGHGAIV